MNSREKGKRGEREWAKFCREQGFDAKRGQQYCGANGDADVIGLPNMHIEVKRVERLMLYDALGQAQRDAKENQTPIVVHRKNNRKWVVIMDAEDWFDMYKESSYCEDDTDWCAEHDCPTTEELCTECRVKKTIR